MRWDVQPSATLFGRFRFVLRNAREFWACKGRQALVCMERVRIGKEAFETVEASEILSKASGNFERRSVYGFAIHRFEVICSCSHTVKLGQSLII